MIQNLNYASARWLLVGAIAAHNFEEWLAFPSFELTTNSTLARLGIDLQSDPWAVTQLALVIVTLLPAILVLFSATGRQNLVKDFLPCIVAGIFFANIFLPHIPLAILNGGYAPGVLTAVLLNMPVTILLWFKAAEEKILTRRQVIGAAIIGTFSLMPSLLAVMLLADRILQAV